MSAVFVNIDDFPLRGAGFEDAFCDFLATNPAHWWLVAPSLELWPINTERVSSALIAWSQAQKRGKAHLMVKSWRWVEADAARFMNWRRLFAHQLDVRGWPARLGDESVLPLGIYSVGLGLQIAPQQRQDVLMARKLDEKLILRHKIEKIGEYWSNATPALPAYRLGL